VRADSPLRSRDFVRVTVGNFFFFLTFASFFLLPLHIRELGGSERTVGFLMGTTGISGLVSVLIVGALLDRYGRGRFLRGGMAVMGVASAAFLATSAIGPLMFALRIVQGLAFSASFNAAATLAAELAPPARRTSALGIFGISTLLTHAIAPSLGEQIVAVGGFGLLFAIAGVYCAIGLAIVWTLPTPRRHAHAGPPPAPLRRVPGFVAAIATIACCGGAFGSVLTFVPTFVRDEGLGVVSAFFLAYTTTAVGVRIVGGGAGDRLGHRPVVLPALALLAVAVGSLALVHSMTTLVLAGLVFGAAQGLVYPTLNAYTVELVPLVQLGRAQSMYNGAFNLGTTFGAMVMGNVVQVYGHRAMFAGAGGLVVVALAVFALGRSGT